MTACDFALDDLGWNPFFERQVRPDESMNGVCPVRVMAVHRGMIDVAGENFSAMISSKLPAPAGSGDRPTVGDWVLLDRDRKEPLRILDRLNLFKRQAPVDQNRLQLIAANVDTVFIVTSCNQDFNVARLERYLVFAREVGVRPVVVLTKMDLAQKPQELLQTARALQPDLDVTMVDARDPVSAAALASYCGIGKTVVLLGSSGVGKSTLVNTLRGSTEITTQAIRAKDGKGRHTTTTRQLHRLDGPIKGGWLLDSPGMREFKLHEAATGIAEVFDDIIALTLECRFTNCTHTVEPDCAIRAALRQNTLEFDRLERWRKLSEEDSDKAGQKADRRPSASNFSRKR